MLIIAQQNHPVSQILNTFKASLLHPSTCWVWLCLSKLSSLNCPRPPCAFRNCSCWAVSQSWSDISPSWSMICRISSYNDLNLYRLWFNSFSDWCVLRHIRSFYPLTLVFPSGSAEWLWILEHLERSLPFSLLCFCWAAKCCPQAPVYSQRYWETGGRGITLTLKKNSETYSAFCRVTKVLCFLSREPSCTPEVGDFPFSLRTH